MPPTDGLKRYFSQYGKVLECNIMKHPTTGTSRGFGFLRFEDPKAVNTVMVREHTLDGKIVSLAHREATRRAASAVSAALK